MRSPSSRLWRFRPQSGTVPTPRRDMERPSTPACRQITKTSCPSPASRRIAAGKAKCSDLRKWTTWWTNPSPKPRVRHIAGSSDDQSPGLPDRPRAAHAQLDRALSQRPSFQPRTGTTQATDTLSGNPTPGRSDRCWSPPPSGLPGEQRGTEGPNHRLPGPWDPGHRRQEAGAAFPGHDLKNILNKSARKIGIKNISGDRIGNGRNEHAPDLSRTL